MNKWINIKDKVPGQDEKVWYFFHGFVYSGCYYKEDTSAMYHRPDGTYMSNVFYGVHGYLTDDVSWWMPRKDGDSKPDKPIEAV